MEVTLLELHVHDAEFNAPFAGKSSVVDAETTPSESESGETTDDGSRLGPLVGLLAFTGLALGARYLRGGQSKQSTLDEVEA